MADHTIDVYYFPPSPPARAVMMLIKGLGIKHNPKIVNLMEGEHMKPEYMKLNPMHTVPTINDAGFILYDSHVILKYLVDVFGKDDSLCPKDPQKGAIVIHRLFFEASYLFPSLSGYTRPVLQLSQQPNPDHLKRIEDNLGLLDKLLENQTWVAGENMTIADISIMATVSTMEAIMVDISQFSNVNSWFERAKNGLSSYGYEEINQPGVTTFANAFKSKVNN